MTMTRREFTRLAALSGVGLLSPMGRAWAKAPTPYTGPLYISVHAGGGWDPTSLCDPKGRENEEAENPVNHYFIDQIGEAGPFKYAPFDGNKAFFDKYKDALLVINGIDTATNGHDSGTRNTWSGKLQEGYPAFNALYAAAVAHDRPMAYITNGGYDHTMGLLAPTRVGNVSAVQRLAFPNMPDVNKPELVFHSESTRLRIQKARDERLQRQIAKATFPKRKQAMSMLYTARLGTNELKKLTEYLPTTLDNSNNPLKKQSQLVIAAYKAGLTASANLQIGGFDTHSNHDPTQSAALKRLLEGVDYLMTYAAAEGVADKLVVCVGSDFGRTPWYNDGNGKDHWSITSMMLMGKGIAGGRLVGATDAYQKPLTVNPKTLALDPQGLRITPEHIHRALRALAGVNDHPIAAGFPLKAELLPLLTG